MSGCSPAGASQAVQQGVLQGGENIVGQVGQPRRQCHPATGPGLGKRRVQVLRGSSKFLLFV